MPQDIRFSPDGRKLYVADMEADGVHVVDGEAFKEIGFITTGVAAHGLYPSRDGKKLYVANRGSHKSTARARARAASRCSTSPPTRSSPLAVPGGGSPDMGNVTADGKYLWLSGRYDDVVYRFDTPAARCSRSGSARSRTA